MRSCGHAAAVLAVLAGLALPAFAQKATERPPAPSGVKTANRTPVTHPDMNVDPAFKRADDAVKAIVSVPDARRTFENTIGAIDDLLARLEDETSMVQFMGYVHPDAAIRDQAQAAEERYGNWLIDLGKREDLYKAVQAYAQSSPKLEGEQKRLLDFIQRDFRRNGMGLSADKRARLTEVQKEINRLNIEFSKNIAEDQSTVHLTRDELRGMPEEFLAGLKRSGDIFLVGLSNPEYMPIQESCEIESTREKMWLAHKRRAGQKNVAILEKSLKLKAEQAQLLGYAHESDYQAEVRMAKDAKTIAAFYEKLRPLVRKKAEKDHAELTAAKRQHTSDDNATLQPWDYFFYNNYLLRTKYAVDSQKVKEYFPLDRTIDGLFSITQSLFGLEYKDVTAARAGTSERPLWHPEVRLFEVYDKASGTMIGEFYLDLHPRENKYNHAAQWGLSQHKVWSDGRVTRPLAALVCNFTKPTAEKPSLLDHKGEVDTFFHEFGHCLHTIVSEARFNRFAGTNVELDFVEAPSQMFEEWVWDAKVLSTFARHYKTGEAIPADLVDAMVRARRVGSGMDAETQFFYGLTDQAYETTSDGVVDTTKVAHALYPQATMFGKMPEHTYYQAAFGHLMNYSAGYYGYMWSLVYASDMAVRFKELGMLSPEAGMYYRRKIISQGGTRDAMDLVKDYLGREPRLDSFLEHLGLEEGK
ncbi:MAG TPA: M3 family metallopeptidase [Phycisphaerales bacterium]|nr:M3 family metallopeptidase [Phycisphaerales bacterium]